MSYVPAARAKWAKAAEKLGPKAASAEMDEFFQAVKDGSISTLQMPWTQTRNLTQALVPGGITTLCGTAAHGKSLWLLQLSYFVHSQGIPSAVYFLEHPQRWHARRLYIQLSGDSRLADNDWVKESNGHVAEIMRPYDEAVDGFFANVRIQGNGQASYGDLLKWLDDGIARGIRYFAIDPITGIKPPPRPWEADQTFLSEARKIMEESNASLVLMTHPRKGNGKQTGLSDMANGAAFERFTDCVLWLDKPDKPPPVKIKTEKGEYTVLANRTLKINKASNARGGGVRIGLKFEDKNFTYRELGIVVKDEEKAKNAGIEQPYIAEPNPDDISNLFDKTPAAPARPWMQKQSDELAQGEGQ